MGKQFGNCPFFEDGEVEDQEDLKAMVKEGHMAQQWERAHSPGIRIGWVWEDGGISSYFSVGTIGHGGEIRADPCSIICLAPKVFFMPTFP